MCDDKIFVHVSCGCAVGAPYWQTVDVYESDECAWEAIIWAHRDEWEDGQVRVRCPKCKAYLEDDCHYYDTDAPDSWVAITEDDRIQASYYEEFIGAPPEPIDLGPTATLACSVHRMVPGKGPTGDT